MRSKILFSAEYLFHYICQKEIIMAQSGSKDKGNKEQKKKPKHNLKEKRKLKEEKKHKSPFAPS